MWPLRWYTTTAFSFVDIDLGERVRYSVTVKFGGFPHKLSVPLCQTVHIARTVVGTYLSIKELLYARQTLFPIDAQPRHRSVYRVFRNRKDDRWNIVIME